MQLKAIDWSSLHLQSVYLCKHSSYTVFKIYFNLEDLNLMKKLRIVSLKYTAYLIQRYHQAYGLFVMLPLSIQKFVQQIMVLVWVVMPLEVDSKIIKWLLNILKVQHHKTDGQWLFRMNIFSLIILG